MTTMPAIDRVVHHSLILDLMRMDIYRTKVGWPTAVSRYHLHWGARQTTCGAKVTDRPVRISLRPPSWTCGRVRRGMTRC
jgi:hypothetical protein